MSRSRYQVTLSVVAMSVVNRIAGILVNVPEGVRGKYMRNCHYPISVEWGDAIVLSLQQKLVENSVKNATSIGYSYQHY